MKRNITRRKALRRTGSSVALLSLAVGSSQAAPTKPPEPTPENTVSYTELTAEGKEVVDLALDEGVYESRHAPPEKLRQNAFVELNGELYRIESELSHERRNRIAPKRPSASIQKKEELPAIVAVNDLPAAKKAVAEEAIRNGGMTWKATDSWTFSFEDKILYKNGDAYVLNFAHMDIPRYTVELQNR